MFMLQVPSQFVNKKFNELFKVLNMDYQIIPIGLYRSEKKFGENQRPYVLLKPKEETIILATDQIFVLSHRFPEKCKIHDINYFSYQFTGKAEQELKTLAKRRSIPLYLLR